MGDVLTGFACYDEALAALRRGARLMGEKHRPRVWLYVGHVYCEKGNYRSAEHWYRRSVDADPTTMGLAFLGALLAKRGCFGEAKRCYRRAIRLATETPGEAYFNLGLILRAEWRYREAIESFDRAIEIDPAYELAEKARRDCERAIELRKELR